MNIGSLVKLFRRITPGLGVIVEYIEDISFYCANGMDDIENLVDDWNKVTSYSGRNRVLNDFIFNSQMKDELGNSFLLTNGFYRYTYDKTDKNIKSVKLSYVKIMWIIPPSNYSIRTATTKIDWYPKKWLREVSEKP
jgi:hypothetical protein